MTLNSDPTLAAASLINALSLIMFWLKHLPTRLPQPRPNHEGIYNHFYRVMQQVHQLNEHFPESIPDSTGVVTIKVRPACSHEVQVLDVLPAPQPKHRPPRDGAASTQHTPEARPLPNIPAPLPPSCLPNKRKDYIPVRLD